MAYKVIVYGNIWKHALTGKITDLSSAGTVIKCCLLGATYTFNQDTHVSYNDVSSYEISSSSPNVGYTTGGATLANKTVAYSSRVTAFDADDVTWAGATFSARYGCIYDDTPASATDKKLLALVDFGELKSVTAMSFQIVWSAAGIFLDTVSAT